MIRAGFKPTIPVFGWSEIICALDRDVTEINGIIIIIDNYRFCNYYYYYYYTYYY
jgi:hypothetical protein